jgi:hypothetical protein
MPAIIWYIALLIVALVVAYAMAPKPPEPEPPELNDIDAPTAEEGKDIPVLFGTCLIRSPNIVWYGKLRTTPIRKKAGK